jgi:hypothetical protein
MKREEDDSHHKVYESDQQAKESFEKWKRQQFWAYNQ